ncbi:uncharacterized protein ASPGLDRAFT_35764 [Aspergillus glaucus CBS 516.65]|uniref:SRR1-like domain-containing protein n=1 Tax=Aspergillus glaucus CBS 516.65 TaxID=1160497 RepID=A0A1L9VIL6_ASPGL|nr:hypothetical protein ASPGLDRAFT_35764 [Aspergillus glaucus CBS 516.65]OJJ83740.1 hypothetical protein ASPGLDRAFT_35764 [Aspergillus glaucus CBS 516.65]
MLAMAKTLEEQNGNKVKCYAQDPANNGVGDKFLESIGINPLRDPKGFLEVDAETFISASPDQPIRQVIADLEKPAVILWKSVEKEPQDESYGTDPVSSRVLDMVKEYEQLLLDYVDNMFGKPAWYVRKDMNT